MLRPADWHCRKEIHLLFPLFLPGLLQESEGDGEARSAVEGRFVGRIVVRAVVINDVARLVLLIVHPALGADAYERTEYGFVDRTVYQSARRVAQMVTDDIGVG